MTTTNRFFPRQFFASPLARAAVLVLLSAATVDAQRSAVSRSGGGSSGGGGGRGGGGGSISSSGSSGGSSVSGGSHRSTGRGRSATARDGRGSSRGPHRPTGTYRRPGNYGGGRGGGGQYYYNGYYPYYGGHYGYYNSFYFGLGYGYPLYYGYPGYYRPYAYYPHVGGGGRGGGDYSYSRNDLGAVSLKVKPKNAEVYVDGRYVGAAKSFDGTPRYLWLAPGRYDLTLYCPGYTNLSAEIEITPSEIVKYSLELERGEAVRPDPPEPPAREPYRRHREHAPPPTAAPRSTEPSNVSRTPVGADARREPGGVVLEVHPADASVYLDGRFIGTGREVSTLRSPLLVDPGSHTLQVIHPDYLSEDIEFEIGSGVERDLEVMLGEKTSF
ncbi:MAG: PEGA domain-containing protein [Acidobacteriota bacterium]|nr:PEGA domain-containing protein [Acidobacteriota bacterium]